MTRGGGLLAAAASASRLTRWKDGPLHRLLPLRRALTADAAESVQQEEQQQQQHHRPLLLSNADDESESASAHARRLREMEASTSIMRGAAQLETASEVAARLRSEQRSGGKAYIRSSSSPPSPSPLRSPDASPSPSEESNRPNPAAPLRDWRDALEAARMLDPRGDPLTDTFG